MGIWLLRRGIPPGRAQHTNDMSNYPVVPRSEIADQVLRLHAAAVRYRGGELAPSEFRAERVLQGVYEQRTRGTFMLRVRVPAGTLSLPQLRGLTRVVSDSGVAHVHLTTRQDAQLHDLSLEAALEAQAELLSQGLTTYASGGNTVRNIVADPFSGLSPNEAFDVRPYAVALASRYEGPGRYPNLPRKFKIAFSACEADRAGACTADLGFVAARRGDRHGFRVWVGGGLGGGATVGLELSSWVEADAVASVTDGLLAMFSNHGERVQKHKARLRHLRQRLGDEEFLRLCSVHIEAARNQSRERLSIHAERRDDEYPTLPSALPPTLEGHPGIMAQGANGRYALRLAPARGDLFLAALSALGDVVEDFAAPTLRIGLAQDLWLTDLGGAAVEFVLARLSGHALGTPLERTNPIIACSGAATCQLGLLRSGDAADAIERHLSKANASWQGVPMRISGCPNACARHLATQLGFEGRLRRINGRMLPSYAVFVGGSHARKVLAAEVGVVPAKRLAELVAAVTRIEGARQDTTREYALRVEALAAQFGELPSVVPEDWYADWGEDASLDLDCLGEGECSAG